MRQSLLRLTRTAVVLVLVASMTAGAHGALAARASGDRGPLVRKNVLELSKGERKAFVKAVLLLKEARSPYDPTLSYYDQFVAWHLTLYRCTGLDFDITAGHGGPFFLPWHRAFVQLFEQALAEVSGERIAVPYWDWTSEASTKSVFADDFMGGDGNPDAGYAVTSGPFRKGAWTVTQAPDMAPWSTSFRPYLVRKHGSGGITELGRKEHFPLPVVGDVTWALSAQAYDAEPYDMRSDPNVSFRNALEGWWRADPTGRRYADPIDHQHCGPDGRAAGTREAGNLHNKVHSWAGGIVGDTEGGTLFGTMLMPNSPADPVFFLHHSNIDRLWAKWQTAHGTSFQPEAEQRREMAPFAAAGVTLTPSSVSSITELGYRYSDHVDTDDVAPAVAVSAAAGSGGSGLAGPVPTTSATFAFGCAVPA